MAAQAAGAHVRTESLQEGVLQLIISERRLNLFTRAVMEEFITALEALRQEPALRLLVLRGEGHRAFVGGADIRELAALDSRGALALITQIHQCCHLLRSFPVPSIAVIEGYCLGAGMELAASCDLRLGSQQSHYGMPEVQVGLPSVVEAALLPHLIGWGKTRELLYRGNLITAEEALRIGFLQACAPPGELDSALQAWLDDLLRAGPQALRAQKRLLEGWLEPTLAHGVQAGVDAFRQCYDSGEPQRMLQAFLARKRQSS